MQRSLAAFEAVQRYARPSRLTLASAGRGFALARADAPPNPLRAVMRPGIVSDLVELHRLPDPCAAGANPALTHQALRAWSPLSRNAREELSPASPSPACGRGCRAQRGDRKSTRLNSSHPSI